MKKTLAILLLCALLAGCAAQPASSSFLKIHMIF